MISFELGVEDLADTRFALSPLGETVLSLRILRDPGISALHLPWYRSVLPRLGALDRELLRALVADRLTLPDFLTPRPTVFEPSFADELAVVRRTPPSTVTRDLLAAHSPNPLPHTLLTEEPAALRDRICALLAAYWELAVRSFWPQIRLVAEADMTYRARQLARGGARMLFADMHPQLRWEDDGSRGVLRIHRTIGGYHTKASGRGLLLAPSVFCHKPAPPVGPDEPPGCSIRAAGSPPCGARPPTPPTRPSSGSSAHPGLGCSPSWRNPGPPPNWPVDCGSRRARSPSTCASCTTRAWPPVPARAAMSSTAAPRRPTLSPAPAPAPGPAARPVRGLRSPRPRRRGSGSGPGRGRHGGSATAALRLPDSRLVRAVDVPPWLRSDSAAVGRGCGGTRFRSDAPCSPERLFCHVCGRAKTHGLAVHPRLAIPVGGRTEHQRCDGPGPAHRSRSRPS